MFLLHLVFSSSKNSTINPPSIALIKKMTNALWCFEGHNNLQPRSKLTATLAAAVLNRLISLVVEKPTKLVTSTKVRTYAYIPEAVITTVPRVGTVRTMDRRLQNLITGSKFANVFFFISDHHPSYKTK
ncbi:hypothetical protein ACJX0J_015125 [Zea mays]